MTFTLNVTPKSCERCGYNAQFNWEGVNVCGSGCYELLMIQRAKHGPEWVAFSIQKLLGDSVLEVQETIGNIVKAGEFVKIWSTARYYPASESCLINTKETIYFGYLMQSVIQMQKRSSLSILLIREIGLERFRIC